jgi:hypothetical protein
LTLRPCGSSSLSSEAPDVIVFEAESHEDIRKKIA